MRLNDFFGILSALAFMAVIWLTILSQLDGALNFFTGLLVVGSVVYVVRSAIWELTMYH